MPPCRSMLHDLGIFLSVTLDTCCCFTIQRRSMSWRRLRGPWAGGATRSKYPDIGVFSACSLVSFIGVCMAFERMHE